MTELWFYGGMGVLLSLSIAEDSRPSLRFFRRVWTVTYAVGCVVLLVSRGGDW